jgi:zinc/manganese transport system ATP-binding protein
MTRVAAAFEPAVAAFENVTLGYDRHPAVHHLTGALARGSLTAVIGPNGAGKTTLLRGLMGTLKPIAGRLRLHGVERAEIAYLPQQSEIDRSFPISVFDTVALGLWRRTGLLAGLRRVDEEAVARALATVGLEGFARRPLSTLSGGQVQRVLFARLLLQDARIILLDEPFTSIDQKTVADLLALVERWHREERTIVAVLHDLETVRRHFPQTMLMARECLAWGPTSEVLTPENWLRARRMSEAFDDTAPVCDRDAEAPHRHSA